MEDEVVYTTFANLPWICLWLRTQKNLINSILSSFIVFFCIAALMVLLVLDKADLDGLNTKVSSYDLLCSSTHTNTTITFMRQIQDVFPYKGLKIFPRVQGECTQTPGQDQIVSNFFFY